VPHRLTLTEAVTTHALRLLALPGVVGVAEGESAGGAPCVRIYVTVLTPDLRGWLPPVLEGWPVEVEECGPVRPVGG